MNKLNNCACHKTSLILCIVIDIALVAAILIVFALFHHVIPREYSPSSKASAAICSSFDFDCFVDKTETTDNSYKSKNISVTTTRYEKYGTAYYVQDIYVRYIECIRTAFASGKFGVGFRDKTKSIAAANNAIIAISGDYCGARDIGVVIRNGKLYRDKKFRDVCVLYNNGEMKTMTADAFDSTRAMENGAYQAWGFGPALLRNSEVIADFDSDVSAKNPRCAIGYFEPGHYCFVVADGRGMGKSTGLTLYELSSVMHALGCKYAYNLDGGVTAVMVHNGTVVNMPKNGGRTVSDIIYVCEVDI